MLRRRRPPPTFLAALHGYEAVSVHACSRTTVITNWLKEITNEFNHERHALPATMSGTKRPERRDRRGDAVGAGRLNVSIGYLVQGVGLAVTKWPLAHQPHRILAADGAL